MSQQFLQGTLDLLILRTLLAGPTHGHAVAKHIQRTSEDLLQVETGSLYPALHRLEAKGWIGATWDLSDKGKRARFYRLTARRLTREAHLQKEIQLHRDEEASDRGAGGVPERESYLPARGDLGNLARV